MDNTMLIVDDNEMNREILRLLFQDQFMIVEAQNGQEALDFLEGCRGNIDIVLLDIVMPEMGGKELLEIRAKTDYLKSVPFVIISAATSPEEQVETFKLGVSDYIEKPFVPEIVISRIDNVMASRKRMIDIQNEAKQFKTKAELDEMTGLLNKATAELNIDAILRNTVDERHVLIAIDIDNFKTVNDVSGHQSGDDAIKVIANLLSSFFRKSDIVGRIGGDEFVALMRDVPSIDIVRKKMSELIAIMKYKPHVHIPEYVSLSIGYASNDSEPTTYVELFKKADKALYNAKANGKARFCEYGLNDAEIDDSDAETVIIISHSRDVCSKIPSCIPISLASKECLNYQDIKDIEIDHTNIVGVYVDISEPDIDGDECFKMINDKFKNPNIPIFAICEENNFEQYTLAIQQEVKGIISTPIDPQMFKRISAKYILAFQ